MNFIFTLLAIFGSIIILGGAAIFVMNIASKIVYVFLDKKRKITTGYKIGISVLTVLHSYIYLSFISFVILLCYACQTNSILTIILWIITGIVCIVLTWSAYVQAKNKLNDAERQNYEPTHVIGLSLNALISSIGFFVLAIYPHAIDTAWPWVRSLHNWIFN